MQSAGRVQRKLVIFTEHRDIYVDVLGQFVAIGNNPPVSTLLGVQALAMPGLLIEIEAIAAVSRS